jgi:hypothetical protein
VSSAFIHATGLLRAGETLAIYSNSTTSDVAGAATYTFPRVNSNFRCLGWYLATAGTTPGGRGTVTVDSNQVGPVAHVIGLPLCDYYFDDFTMPGGVIEVAATDLDASQESRLFAYLALSACDNGDYSA